MAFIPAMIFVFTLDMINIRINPESYEYYANFNPVVFILNLLMITVKPFGSARQFWTLTNEWWLYMLVGFLSLCLKPACHEKKKIKIYQIVITIFLLVIPVYYLLKAGRHLTGIWILGAVIFFIYKKVNIRCYQINLIFALALLAGSSVLMKDAYSYLCIMAASYVFLALMVFGNHVKKEIHLPGIKFLASYTYSLYLVHYSLMYFIHFTIENNKIGFLISVVVSNIIAIIFAHFFESKYRLVGNYIKKAIIPLNLRKI